MSNVCENGQNMVRFLCGRMQNLMPGMSQIIQIVLLSNLTLDPWNTLV